MPLAALMLASPAPHPPASCPCRCPLHTGKAAAAGILLPVAVGLEIVALPGTGWFAAYQLYKNSVSAAGGSRLKNYLLGDNDVRVNYAPEAK